MRPRHTSSSPSAPARSSASARAVAAALAVAPVAFAAWIACAAAGCSADPVQSDAISALGKEKGSANEFHRAGQPCGLCHQKGGSAPSDFSIAGTIFAAPNSLVGVEAARIDLVDANKTSPPLATPIITNCVGNFFIRRSDWDPAFPVSVRVTKGGTSRTMNSQISRTSSCADCHKAQVPLADPFSSLGPIYLFGADGDPAGKAQACDRDPDVNLDRAPLDPARLGLGAAHTPPWSPTWKKP